MVHQVTRRELELAAQLVDLDPDALYPTYEYAGKGTSCVAVKLTDAAAAVRLFFQLGRGTTHYASTAAVVDGLHLDPASGRDNGIFVVMPNVRLSADAPDPEDDENENETGDGGSEDTETQTSPELVHEVA